MHKIITFFSFRFENKNFLPDLTSWTENQTHTTLSIWTNQTNIVNPARPSSLYYRLCNSAASYKRGLKVETEPSTAGRYRMPKPVWIVYIGLQTKIETFPFLIDTLYSDTSFLCTVRDQRLDFSQNWTVVKKWHLFWMKMHICII